MSNNRMSKFIYELLHEAAEGNLQSDIVPNEFPGASVYKDAVGGIMVETPDGNTFLIVVEEV